MRPALITVVNPQDNDVIENQLRYYYNIGIRDFYFMLHMPDNILLDIVTILDMTFKCNFKIFYNHNPEHYHEKDCKVLSDKAIEDGCDWIIGSDADELLVLKKHKTIQEFLSEYNDYSEVVLHFKWIDYRAEKDVYNNAFINMGYKCKDFMDVTDAGWIKSCGKFNEKMLFIPGFHNIVECDNIVKIDPETAFFAHFPERNFEQYENKTKLQRKNWIQRYGFFYMDKDIEENPDFLKTIWPDRLITISGQRQVCNNDKSLKDSNKIEYFYDPINPEMFK